MRDRRELARLALALVEGSLTVGDAADELFVDAFESLEEAATAHAYLAGFILEYLAVERGEQPVQTVAEIRRLLA
ncbi:MAG TPA: hypothetical protein VFZ17_08730 [Acidimicrobiia bacterium]|nr:hypothetical protein [Acidimicrobiia bacterium]